VLLNLRINKDLELVLSHFLEVKYVRHLPYGFEFSGFNIPELHAGVYVNRLIVGSNREGCVRGLKSLKGLI